MYCSKCGAELQENAKFCSRCGNKVTEKKIQVLNINSIITSGIFKRIILQIILCFMLAVIVLGSFLPIIKEKSYEHAKNYNFYQYVSKLGEEVDVDEPFSYSILNMLEIEGWFDDVVAIAVIIIAAVAIALTLICGSIAIYNYIRYKIYADKAIPIFFIAAEIFAICSAFLVWGGIAYGDKYFLHYNYIWGEYLPTERSVTIWLILLLIFPVCSFLLWRQLKPKFVLEKKICPKCGRENLIGNKCTYCDSK